jgi:hypothetical protein
MDARFQPQQAMSYEAILKESSLTDFSARQACLDIRAIHIELDFYEVNMIDTGIVGLLNAIALTEMGFALAVGSLAVGVATPLAVAGALTGVFMMAVGIVDFQTYLSHIVSGGSYFPSRRAMEEYENPFGDPKTKSGKATKWGLKKLGDYALEKRIEDLGSTVELKQLPDRDDLSMAREFLTILDEKLECRTPPGAQGVPATDSPATDGLSPIQEEILREIDDILQKRSEEPAWLKPAPLADPPRQSPVNHLYHLPHYPRLRSNLFLFI